jgi:hypothetical protein
MGVCAPLQQFDRHVELLQREPLQLRGGPAAALALGGGMGRRTALTLGSRQRRGNSQPHDRRERRQNGCVPRLPPAPWWTARPASSRKPATYRCPICGRHLPALSEHMLIAPEGDTRRRRHAHTACVLAARRRGQLLLREDWLRTQPRRPPLWRRLLRREE